MRCDKAADLNASDRSVMKSPVKAVQSVYVPSETYRQEASGPSRSDWNARMPLQISSAEGWLLFTGAGDQTKCSMNFCRKTFRRVY